MHRTAMAATMLTLVLWGSGCTTTPVEEPACEVAAPDALATCVADYATAVASCLERDGQACGAGNRGTNAALEALEASVEISCEDTGLGTLGVDAAVGRLRNACKSEAEALSWRAYGGPQSAVWSAGTEQSCLSEAHAAGAELMRASLAEINTCIASGSCDGGALDARRDELEGSARGAIDGACSDLGAIIAVDSATFVERTARQVDCLASAVHPDPAGARLRCGPSHAQFDSPRGEWTLIEVDGDEWGTLCGDGSPYAFHVRFAPEGARLDRLIIGLEGGGVCLFEEDCGARMTQNPGLFNAMDDEPLTTGIMSNDPAESGFADWTKIYLPYCNQDVFAGGGVDEELGNTLSLPRYGSVNMRAAVQMVRDVLWEKMDADGGDGFRPDEVVALFGGWSAGGYGTLYNYHWFLDDLLWPRTAAFPDAGLALDNGATLGVRGLGLVKLPVWGTQKNLPPYCFAGECAAGDTLVEAISPRLKRVPEQQMLIVSNPFDETQQRDAFFDDTPSFINAMRASYCNTKDLVGIQYFFTSTSNESVHVVSPRPEHWDAPIAGIKMKDWFWGAVTAPDEVTDVAEEGDFTTVFPGVLPYGCELPLFEEED